MPELKYSAPIGVSYNGAIERENSFSAWSEENDKRKMKSEKMNNKKNFEDFTRRHGGHREEIKSCCIRDVCFVLFYLFSYIHFLFLFLR